VASAFSHAVAALSLGACFYRPCVPKRVWVAGALCSVIPDIDVVGFRFGIRYGDFWGHRGFTHSIIFAALLTGVVMFLCFPRGVPGLSRFSLSAYLFLATASHGVLDAMTNGGLGVAFFSPFDNGRYFLPWKPIRVSPISLGRFFSRQGYLVLKSELLWIWLPAGLFAVTVLILRARARRDGGELINQE
jgi:inner membrane protein